MENNQDTTKFIKITETTARYILETARNLLRRLHGEVYIPGGDYSIDAYNGEPTVFQEVGECETTYDWLGAVSMLLKMLSGIVSRELDVIEDGNDENKPPASTGAQGGLSVLAAAAALLESRERNSLPPALYADDDELHSGEFSVNTDDVDDYDIQYGPQ